MNLDEFRDDFSRNAFKIIKTPDGPRNRLVGKFVDIEAVAEEPDPLFDVWLVCTDRQPIGARKLNNLIAAICALPAYSAAVSPLIRKLDGEAYLCTTSVALVREVGFTAGISRRKRYSATTRQAMRERLVQFNQMRGAA